MLPTTSSQQLFERIDFNNPALSAIQRLRLVEQFGMEESQQLARYSNELLHAATTALQESRDRAARETARPTTPTRSRVARPLSSPEAAVEGQPAPKRAATSRQLGNRMLEHALPGPRSAHSPNNAFLHSIQSSMHPTNYSYMPDNTGHPAASYVSQASGSVDCNAPHPSDNTSMWDGAPNPTEQNARFSYPPQNNFGTNYGQYQQFNHSSSGGSGSSGGGESSFGTQGNTVFTGVPSNYSHSHTAPYTEPTTSESTRHNEAIEALKLAKMLIDRNPKIGPLTEGKWVNVHKHKIIDFFFGPQARVPANSRVPLGNYRGKLAERLPQEWNQLAVEFDGTRSAQAIAHHWVAMEDMFCQILLQYSEGGNNSLQEILGRIYHDVATANLFGVSGDVPTWDLLAWIDEGEAGWFAQVYNRVGNAPAITARIEALRNLRNTTIRASSTPSVLSNPSAISRASNTSRKRAALSARNEGSAAVLSRFDPPTPFPPGSEHASIQPKVQPPRSLPTQSESQEVGDPAQNSATAEMMRENKASNRAMIDLAHAKAAYLRTQAEETRHKMYKEALAFHLEQRERQYKSSMAIIMDPNITDPDIRNAAKAYSLAYLDGRLPNIDFKEAFDNLGKSLPTVEQIADVYRNAPALAPGVFEAYYESLLASAARMPIGAEGSQAPNPAAAEFTVPPL
ncbi:hypothetical protein RhiLY_01536 [Ceratobasidium sp. AG-Ba]|nr:hypothetical protein RhiLY_01536 [Ceratobasidium sp. AG-Ba]